MALKGADTYIVQPDGHALRWRGGTPGLAISESIDTLAGVIAGISARGADAFQACAWGVALHALAGKALSRRYGALGFLAHELPEQLLEFCTLFLTLEPPRQRVSDPGA